VKFMIKIGTAAAVLLCLWTNIGRAQVKDAAELLPAQTLAYAEFNQPGKLAKEVAQLIKGSPFDNLPLYLAKHRKEKDLTNAWVLQEVGMFGIFLNPELLNEVGRAQGAAVALTGFTKDNEPEIVGFILAGESNAPTFVMRTMLTMMDVRVISEFEKVPLYQEYGRNYSKQFKGGGKGEEPPLEYYGPVMALLPDAMVMGSTVESVKEVISRYLGKNTTSSLASLTAFKQAAGKLKDRPGIFGFVDCAGLIGQLDGPQREAMGISEYEVEVFKILVNPKAIKTMAASLWLQDGDLGLEIRCTIDPKEKSAILDLLSDKPTGLEILHSASRDSLFTIATGFPEGEQRWKKILGLADAVAKAGHKPEELWPSKAITELEKKHGIQLGKDLFGKIKTIALTMDMRGQAPEKGPRLPLLSVQAEDEAGAKKIEDLVPHVFAFLGYDSEDAPAKTTVDGYTIRTLSDPQQMDIHYGRQGALIVFGQNRQLVAEALKGWDKKEGIFGDKKVAEALKRQQGIGVGTWSLGESSVLLLEEMGEFERRGFKRPFPGSGSQPKPDKNPFEKQTKELSKVMEPLPPSTIVLNRQSDSLTLEIRQEKLRSVSGKVIEILFQAGLEAAMIRRGVIEKELNAPPPPPPPPPPKGSGS
jgi:hypothetical protein